MEDSHDYNCQGFFEKFLEFCRLCHIDYLDSDIWRYIRRRETPCVHCCSWLEKNKSNLSGRIYKIQVHDYMKTKEYTANKIAVVFDIVE